MTSNDSARLEKLIEQLHYFKKNLDSSNLQEFEALKQELHTSLGEKFRSRLSMITFYTQKTQAEKSPFETDDLPF